MEDKRKIVVPLESGLETPHFDAEETLLSARPVVPLAPGETRTVSRSTQTAARTPFYKSLPFLALIIVAAIGIGTLGGLNIARYQYEKRSAAPVVAQPAQAPVTADARTATVRTPATTEQAQAPSVPEVKFEDKSAVERPAVDDVEDVAKAPAPRTKVSDDVDDKKAGAKKGEKKDDDVRAAPPVSRDRARVGDDENDIYIPRAQRRERRRRNNDDEVINVPRQVERTSEQINRIREIFEGRQQRP